MGGLGERMKSYEDSFRIKMPKRLPVIIRIDGKAFHTYTKGMKRPFDEDLAKAFWETAKFLGENVMGCKLVYTQSDEISLLLTDYDKLTTDAWFDKNLQKIVSVSASFATAKFNEIMRQKYPDKELAFFDARAYVLPKDEVANYFLWRQQDATKNSISMLAQSLFSHSELQGLNGSKMQDLMFTQRGVNWNAIPTWCKRGVCVSRVYREESLKLETKTINIIRNAWTADTEIPIFSENRAYVEQHVYLHGEAFV